MVGRSVLGPTSIRVLSLATGLNPCNSLNAAGDVEKLSFPVELGDASLSCNA